MSYRLAARNDVRLWFRHNEAVLLLNWKLWKMKEEFRLVIFSSGERYKVQAQVQSTRYLLYQTNSFALSLQ
jgi:hypothetical protein